MDMTSSTFLTNNFDHGRNGNSEVTLIKNQLGQLQDTVALMEKRLDDLEKGTSSVETELAPTETLPTYSEHASTSTLPTPILDNGQLSLLDPFDSSRENDELWKLIFAVSSLLALLSPHTRLTFLYVACGTSCPQICFRAQDLRGLRNTRAATYRR